MIYYYWDNVSGYYLCLECDTDAVIIELYRRGFCSFTVIPFGNKKYIEEIVSAEKDRFYYFEVD